MVTNGCKETQNYLPLKEGNKWEYKIIAADGTEIQQYATVQLTEFDGKECYAIVRRCDKPEYNYTDYFSVQDNMIIMVGSIITPDSPREVKVKFEPPVVFLKYPLEAKVSWSVKTTLSMMQNRIPMNWKVNVLQKEIVTVPAGTFESYRLEIELERENAPIEKNSYWLSNRVGVVKKVGPHATYDLVSYHIEK